MPRREITRDSSATVGFERPSVNAELTIVLVPLAGQGEPFLWRGRRKSTFARWTIAIARIISRQ